MFDIGNIPIKFNLLSKRVREAVSEAGVCDGFKVRLYECLLFLVLLFD